jgi:hypothetical protein
MLRVAYLAAFVLVSSSRSARYANPLRHQQIKQLLSDSKSTSEDAATVPLPISPATQQLQMIKALQKKVETLENATRALKRFAPDHCTAENYHECINIDHKYATTNGAPSILCMILHTKKEHDAALVIKKTWGAKCKQQTGALETLDVVCSPTISPFPFCFAPR